jgi:hypothetical protein
LANCCETNKPPTHQTTTTATDSRIAANDPSQPVLWLIDRVTCVLWSLSREGVMANPAPRCSRKGKETTAGWLPKPDGPFMLRAAGVDDPFEVGVVVTASKLMRKGGEGLTGLANPSNG